MLVRKREKEMRWQVSLCLSKLVQAIVYFLPMEITNV